MKLPPLALVAPSLCPRCDQPAMVMVILGLAYGIAQAQVHR